MRSWAIHQIHQAPWHRTKGTTDLCRSCRLSDSSLNPNLPGSSCLCHLLSSSFPKQILSTVCLWNAMTSPVSPSCKKVHCDDVPANEDPAPVMPSNNQVKVLVGVRVPWPFEPLLFGAKGATLWLERGERRAALVTALGSSVPILVAILSPS